jgi:hypothetical protein
VSISKMILDGLILSAIASVLLVVTLRLNPRIWLQDYPHDIQARVPPKTARERQLSVVVGIPFLILLVAGTLISTLALKRQHQGEISLFSLVLHAFGILFIFNGVDWLVLDWLMFCTITPGFVVIPGSEGAEGYKNYWFHFRGFLIGTALSAVAGLLIGAIASLI